MSDLHLLDAEFSPARIKLAREIAKRHGLKMRRQWAEGSFRLTSETTGHVVGGDKSRFWLLTPGDIGELLGEPLPGGRIL